MQRKVIWTVVAVLLLAALAAAQQDIGSYLDVFTVQVKPERRADFDAIARKVAAANRQNKGDTWIAMETVYGPGNRVTFVSTRNNYGEIEAASNALTDALSKAYGKQATAKIFQDINQCTLSSRSEVRRRRWDLSSNAPKDAEAYVKMIAEARWLRTVTVRVRPGEASNFEALLKEMKEAREKSSPSVTTFVSQAVAGQEGTVYYVTTPETSLAGFDSIPQIQQVLGDEGYAKFLKTSAESVSDTETAINHFLPDLSNPPEQIAAAAPDFWRPKSMVAANKPKTPMVNAGDTTKMENKDKH